MAHQISPGPHPNIALMRIWGDLQHVDMNPVDGLGLNEGKPVYVLLDVSEMHLGLPDGFLDGARNSYFVHPNMVHMAFYSGSSMLNTIAAMVGKLTSRQHKISIHKSYDSALNHLQEMIKHAEVAN
jgi:hypothetical protein